MQFPGSFVNALNLYGFFVGDKGRLLAGSVLSSSARSAYEGVLTGILMVNVVP